LLRNGLLRVASDENFRGLVVNLAGVTFIDSTGIGVLVGVWHRVRASDSSLALAMPSGQVQKVLDATGLTQVLPVHGHEEDAVQACVQRSMHAD
jgi:anti-sigma B factor antagonist